jgi:hypothetical protein
MQLVLKPKTMTETIVELREASSEGRLYYRTYSGNKHNLLIVQSLQPRQMAYCVNIDGGHLLLYFDTQRKLQDIEVGISRKHWQKLSNLLEPSAVESEDIFLRGVASYNGKWKRPHIRKRADGSTIRTYAYEHQVMVVTNPDLSAVQITLGSTDKLSRWISLSEHCWVQVAENRLKGLFVKISG